jgi:hypothetical protein
VAVDQASSYTELVIILVRHGMSIRVIVDAVKSGAMTQKQAMWELAPYMRTQKRMAEAAVSEILEMPEEPDQIPDGVRNTLSIVSESSY